jgi:hypothetical protein
MCSAKTLKDSALFFGSIFTATLRNIVTKLLSTGNKLFSITSLGSSHQERFSFAILEARSCSDMLTVMTGTE